MGGVRRGGALVLAALAGVALGACGPARANLDPASIRMPTTERITEAQIASIAATVNGVQVRLAEIGRRRGSSNAVRTLGARMAEEYASLDARLARAVERALIAPRPHRLQADVVAKGAEVEGALEQAAGTEFDRAFLRRQEEMGRWYLAIVEYSLLPSAMDDGLREELQAIRAVAAEQLAAARDVAGD